jgi:acyl-CoA synthetase (AMP-forming)/AMP-acid ligase II
MSGYWRDPDGTAETLVDGWLRTGDLARVDEAGRFRLAGRIKEMFIRGGYNVYPMEVESVLGAHPQVNDIAIVPTSDEVMGEIGVAVVVASDPSSAPSLESLREFGAGLLASYKLPEAVRYVDALPRNAGEKLDRLALSDQGP